MKILCGLDLEGCIDCNGCDYNEGYICPQCKNEEHSNFAQYCKICGLRINIKESEK